MKNKKTMIIMILSFCTVLAIGLTEDRESKYSFNPAEVLKASVKGK